jgi:hypothetical protein
VSAAVRLRSRTALTSTVAGSGPGTVPVAVISQVWMVPVPPPYTVTARIDNSFAYAA